MALLVLLVLRSFLQKRKANRQLAKQKQEIEGKNSELLNKNEEIRTQSEQLEIINEKLKDLDKFKEEMTGMIVHDLKNPLNSIIGLSENAIVKQSSKQMLNMVMNILDVQKYEDSDIVLDTSDKSIMEVAASALHQVNLLYEEKSIKIENQIFNYIVCIEKEIIERVFVNILTNAIKYTPNNGTVSLKSDESSSGFIRVRISDTGEGIPSDKHDSVFGRFEQVMAKKSGLTRSTGIGLTFCKIFVEAHGGEIGVESEVGKGTTFWFTVPKGEQGKKEIAVKEDTIKESLFELTQDDILILEPYHTKLQELEVFEYSDIEKILGQIDFTKTANLVKWKIEIDNALYGVNQEKYLILVGMIKGVK